MNKEKTIPISVVVPASMKTSLQFLAEKDGRTLSKYAMIVLKTHVEQQRRAGKIPEKIEQSDSDSDNS